MKQYSEDEKVELLDSTFKGFLILYCFLTGIYFIIGFIAKSQPTIEKILFYVLGGGSMVALCLSIAFGSISSAYYVYVWAKNNKKPASNKPLYSLLLLLLLLVFIYSGFSLQSSVAAKHATN